VASLAAFLASDEAAFITGAVIPIDATPRRDARRRARAPLGRRENPYSLLLSNVRIV
jgi:hypothetical protein